jgi:adenine phosphoribosyltransferase
MVTKEDIIKDLRTVPDFPKKGIMFKDITTVLKKPENLDFILEEFYRQYKDKGITKVLGIESRGFIFGCMLAHKLNAGFVPIRKPGKLPAETFKQNYELEYGTDTLEMHKDALVKGDRILIHDDLLATGGTAAATIELAKNIEIEQIDLCFLCELDFLKGREKFTKDISIYTLLTI